MSMALPLLVQHVIHLHARLRLAASALGVDVQTLRLDDVSKDIRALLLTQGETDWIAWLNDEVKD